MYNDVGLIRSTSVSHQEKFTEFTEQFCMDMFRISAGKVDRE